MKVSEFKKHLINNDQVIFQLPDGKNVPSHFHVTEVGRVESNFIDCGGTVRQEVKANFQLWSTIDFTHRLKPQKLIGIIEKSDDLFNLIDLEIEVEYQGQTIGKYGLDYRDNIFVLTSLSTDCLANELCGVPEKIVTKISEMKTLVTSSCTPGSGCC